MISGRKLVQFEQPATTPKLFSKPQDTNNLPHNIGASLKLCNILLTSWIDKRGSTVIPAHNVTGLKTVKPVKTFNPDGSITNVHIVLTESEKMTGEIDDPDTTEVISADGFLKTISLTAYERADLMCAGDPDLIITGTIDVPFFIREVAEQKIYPEFRVTLPGSKTVLTYNTENQIVAIHDEMMSDHFNSNNKDRTYMLPNSTDPRIAREIYARLEVVCDAELGTRIPSLKAQSTDWRFSDHGQQKIDKELFQEKLDAGLIDLKNPHAENFAMKTTLFGFSVEGRDDILQLIEVLEKTFQKYKGQVLAAEEGAEKTLRHTL